MSAQVFAPLIALSHKLMPEAHQRRYLLRALLMAVVLRLALFGVMYMIDRALLQHQHPMVDVMEESLRRWDARHYLHLADLGYLGTGEDRFLIVYFPLYPWLVRLVNFGLRDYLISGLSLSFAASVAAGYWLQELLHRQDFDEDSILRSLLFFTCLPGAIYTVLPYTESLFLALTLWTFLAAERQQWFRTGLAGALASATRSTGILLLPALALAGLMQLKTGKVRLAWLLLIPCGLGVYLLLNWKVLGNPLAFLPLQAEHWNQSLIPPWEQVSNTWQHLVSEKAGQHRFTYYEARLLAMLAGPILLIAGFRQRLPLSWQIYAWTSLLIFICAREAISLPRYLYALFPIYPVLAHWTRRPMVFQAALCLSTVLMAGWFVIFMTGNGAM